MKNKIVGSRSLADLYCILLFGSNRDSMTAWFRILFYLREQLKSSLIFPLIFHSSIVTLAVLCNTLLLIWAYEVQTPKSISSCANAHQALLCAVLLHLWAIPHNLSPSCPGSSPFLCPSLEVPSWLAPHTACWWCWHTVSVWRVC